MSPGEKELIFGVFVAAITLLIFSILIILLVYNYFRVRRQRDREILHAVFDTQELERTRIAEDLHDGIGAKLAALKLHNEMVIHDAANTPAAEMARNNGQMLDEVVSDIRRIVRNQASKYIISNGLLLELQTLCNQYRSAASIDIRMDVFEDDIPNHPTLMIDIFRIVQELLHNAVKHSGASTVNMSLMRKPGIVELQFSDNGRGFPEAGSSLDGMGMKNIRARAQLHNGEVTIKSAKDKGVAYIITFSNNEPANL